MRQEWIRKQRDVRREARYGCAAAGLGGRVYVFGGHGHWALLALLNESSIVLFIYIYDYMIYMIILYI